MNEKLNDGKRDPLLVKGNETARWLSVQVLHATAGTFHPDKQSYLFTSLADMLGVAAWWAKQKKSDRLLLEEDAPLSLGFRVDLGDGGILLRAAGDIVAALRTSNPEAFRDGGFHPAAVNLQAAMQALATIEEQAKSAAPRRSA